MAKLIETNIYALVPDDKNFNKGNEYGQHLIEESLRKFGAGRSILIDKNNRIIAGNKTIENAANVGLENVIVVETDGNQIVAVKRKDIDLDSARGRELALADNATGKADLEWDIDAIKAASEQFNIIPEDWGVDMDVPDDMTDDGGGNASNMVKMMVESDDESKMSLLLNELQERGYKCKMV
jgi:hypothetical protein